MTIRRLCCQRRPAMLSTVPYEHCVPDGAVDSMTIIPPQRPLRSAIVKRPDWKPAELENNRRSPPFPAKDNIPPLEPSNCRDHCNKEEEAGIDRRQQFPEPQASWQEKIAT